MFFGQKITIWARPMAREKRHTARGGSVKPGQGTFELRETRSAYSSIFHLENSDIAPE